MQNQEIHRKVSRKITVSEKKSDKKCPAMGKCGSCKWLCEPYEKQLAIKDKMIRDLCGKYVKFDKIIGMENPYHYRNKVHAVFGEDRKHNIISGTYEEKSHRVVPIDSCLLDDEKSDAIILTIRRLLKSFKIRTFNEDTGYGLLRHVLVRSGRYTGQIMVVLVLVSPVMPSKNNFVKALRKEHPEITTVVLNVNGRGTSMVLGEKETVLYGKGYIEDTLCGKTFRISPQSFYQVNPIQTTKLYTKAMEFAGLTGKERVLDAYCGTGTIGIIASDKAKEVIGVELNHAAVRDARRNAKANGVQNICFYEKDAGQFMIQLAEQKVVVDVVIMDPPRAGSDEAFLSALCRLKPEKVVYISCNPETLARDLRYLTRQNYEVVRGVGVDMFPWTGHVETVVLLSQQHADDYIDIELDLEEFDLTSAESKASYREIKEYIYNKYNTKVSTLYIAQIKRKCGIELGINYNPSKKENARVPICPLEKEKMILDALTHFQMI